MKIWKLIILSIIQGITEVLPISSSGHLILFKNLLNINYQGLDLEIFLHIGSLIAIIFFYRNYIFLLLKGTISFLFSKEKNNYKNDFNLFICLIISTLITGLFGLIFNNLIETYLSNILVLPFSFLITSILLFVTSSIKGKKEIKSISIRDSIRVGLFQVLGLIPGISRSGSTIAGCKLSKFDNKSSVKYSYLLFIPITFASFFLKILEFIKEPILMFPFYYYLISLCIVIIFTYFSLKFFIKKINSKTINFVSYYLLILSILIICYYFV